MRLFWEICKLSFRRQLAYRTSNWAGFFTNLFFGLLRASVLIALYAGRDEVAGISLDGAITYTALTQAIIVFLSLFGSYDLMKAVQSGEIAADLLKPLGLYAFWAAKDLGRSLVALIVRGLSIMACYAVFYGITLPQGAGQWLALGAAFTLAWAVSFSWRYLVNLAAFWSPNALGIGRLAFSLSLFFS